MVASIVPASIAATPADRTATQEYLQATYQLEQEDLHDVTASRSGVVVLAERLGQECHGVLAGEPTEEGPSLSAPLPPRARGERQRSELQKTTIEEEIGVALEEPIYQALQAPTEAFAAQVAPLSWSDPRIAPLVRQQASRLEERQTPPVADACADMKAWAQSGYHRLSPASRSFEAAQNAARSRAPAKPRAEPSVESLLKPYEGPRQRKLIRRIRALRTELLRALVTTFHTISRVGRALGEPESPFEEREREPVLGHGKTSAGGTYVVRAERAETSSPGPRCRHPLSVEFSERSTNSVSFSSGSSLCLTGHSSGLPSVECEGRAISITATVPASVRTVTLLLSDGRTITSGVVGISRRYGGPGGVYAQAVRGHSPYPVSLTELAGNGSVVRVVGLARQRCPPKSTIGPLRFVDLVQATTPEGEPFTITGVLVGFGRNRTSLELAITAGMRNVEESRIEVGGKPKAFPWSLAAECPPHPYSIIYGILSPPGASVLARTPTGLVPLTAVPLAADLHAKGPLVYGVFAALPSELIVRSSNGATLYTESLAARAKEEAEFCEGYEEG